MKQVIKTLVILAFLCNQHIIFGEIPAQVDAFKQALKSGVEIPNCANCDFRGTQELAGVNAHKAHLPGINFQPCIVNDVNKNTMMVCIADLPANLTGIDLSDANLFSSCLDEAILDGANLTNAEVSSSSVRFASLKNAKVTGIITTNSTFCRAVMPDGLICIDSWTGQGVTIDCKCTPQDLKLKKPDKLKITTEEIETVEKKKSPKINKLQEQKMVIAA